MLLRDAHLIAALGAGSGNRWPSEALPASGRDAALGAACFAGDQSRGSEARRSVEGLCKGARKTFDDARNSGTAN